MRIFVTGGTGFVGTQVVRRFIENGDTVAALARSETGANGLREIGAEPVLGDMRGIEEWKGAIEGCEVVVHCAAPVEIWGPWEKFKNEIVIASTQLLAAASEAGAKKFIHISSESVLQDREDLVGVSESHPYPTQPNSFYGAAKKLAEIELLRSNAKIDVVVLRPTFVWGEGSAGLKEVEERARAGLFLWASEGRSSFEAIHVTNLAEAVLLAGQRGKGKSVYFVTDDEPSTVREFFAAFFDALGVDVPAKSLPNPMIKVLACVVEGAWRTAGIKRKPPLTRFEWAFIGMPRKYDIEKIKQELGYRPVISRSQGFQNMKSAAVTRNSRLNSQVARSTPSG